jgi:acyl carrier protein
MREALENQRLCEPSLDVEASLAFAVSHPNTLVVDSLATVEILSSLNSVFGTPLPKQMLNHESLTTLSGLTKSLQVLEARHAGTRPPWRVTTRGKMKHEREKETLAKRLREAREYLGLSQEYVARQTGISRPAIQRCFRDSST